MMMLAIAEQEDVQFVPEGGGWVQVQWRQPALAGSTPAALLTLAAPLPGNLRYVHTPSRDLMLCGEVRILDGSPLLETARNRFSRLLEAQGAAEHDTPTEEVLEAALQETGVAWSRRESGYVIPACADFPKEVKVRCVPAAVRVEATLTEWEQLTRATHAALALFLLRTQAGLRFARCELLPNSACVVSHAESEYLDADLAPSLQSVATACRLLAREAAALLTPDLARAYLDCNGVARPEP